MKEDIFCFILMCSGLPFFILDVIGTTEKGIKQIKIGGGLIGVSQAVEFLLKISNVSFKLADLSGWAIVIIGSIILIRAVVFQSQKHGSKNNENEFWNRPGLATLTEQQKREHIQKFTETKKISSAYVFYLDRYLSKRNHIGGLSHWLTLKYFTNNMDARIYSFYWCHNYSLS